MSHYVNKPQCRGLTFCGASGAAVNTAHVIDLVTCAKCRAVAV